MQQKTLKSRNVFENLYTKAQTLQKKQSLNLTRSEKEQREVEQHCTFRPNLNQTMKSNKKVESVVKRSNKVQRLRNRKDNQENRFDTSPGL